MNLRLLQALVTLTSVLQRVIVEIAVLYYTPHQTLRRQTNSQKQEINTFQFDKTKRTIEREMNSFS